MTSLVWVTTCWEESQAASISLHDLNGDGRTDVFVEGPRVENGSRPMLLDGVDGTTIWQSEVDISMITVAQFADLNGDGLSDVIVGGRGVPEDDRPLAAIDGSDGSTIWRVDPIEPAWGNVYTPQGIGDVTDDGVQDWVVATGGDHIREVMEPPTVAGRVMVIDGAMGELVGAAELPEPQEIYNSPVIVDDGEGALFVLVGSGGEVFSGSFWRIALDDVVNGTDSGFEEILAGDDSSYMAPASVGDLDGDGGSEVVVVRTDGLVTAVDPFSGEVLWEVEPAAEHLDAMSVNVVALSVAVPALGQLDADASVEVVTQHLLLAEEDLVDGLVGRSDSVVAVVDGATGRIEHELFVERSDSAQSPLIASTEAGTGVVCACIPSESVADPDYELSRRETRLGWWEPDGESVVDLGLPTSLSKTPAFHRADGDTTGFVLYSAGTYPAERVRPSSITASIPAPNGAPITEVAWGGYMGPVSSGHSKD